jgi:uracil-DNA glycosylase
MDTKSQAIAKLIGEDWCRELRGEFDDPYMTKLQAFIWQRRRSDAAIVYPEPEDVFKAFKVTPFGQVKVVILGQDPYHSPGTANGLAFSTDDDTVPPSLDNIFKELESDVGDGLLLNLDPDLTRWAEQGVFLLNRILTVEEGKPLAHADKGWEIFTRHVIEILNAKRKNVVYMLWGTYAQKLQPLIDPINNLVLTAAHPSPLSAYKGFLGCKHFSQANEYLVMHKKTPIQWV